MKTLLGTTALGGLLVVLATTATGQTLSSPFPTAELSPSIMVAEGGAKRLLQYHEMKREEFARIQAQEEQAGERFAQVLKEQPTAAGPQTEAEEQESMGQPQYKSPIHRDRAEYGLH